MKVFEGAEFKRRPAADVCREDLGLIVSVLDGEPPPEQAGDPACGQRCYLAAGVVFPQGGGVCSLCVHDLTSRSLEFVSRRALPAGKLGRFYVPAADGGMLQILGTVLSCNEFAAGWFEGSVAFQEEHHAACQP